MLWFKRKDKVSLDDALRQLISGIINRDTDLTGHSMHELSESDVNAIQVALPEYKLSMAFNYLMQRKGLSEDELEARFESAGMLAFQDLGESNPEINAGVLMAMKDYYLHDLTTKRETYIETMQRRYEKYGVDEINLDEVRKEVGELGPAFLYHQAFAHLCLPDFDPRDKKQTAIFDDCVRIAKQAEKRVYEALDMMFRKANITSNV